MSPLPLPSVPWAARSFLPSFAAIGGTVVAGILVGSVTGVTQPHSWPRDLLVAGPLVLGAALAAVLQQTLP